MSQRATLSKLFKSALCGVTLLVSTGLTAEAQYYHPAPRYYPAPQYNPQPYPYPQHYDDYRPRQRYQRRVDMGSICVTSRGECGVGRMVPVGTGCKCQIPGFGQKRGHVQY